MRYIISNNPNQPEQKVEKRQGYYVQEPKNLTIPPGLPGFYGYYESETGNLRAPNERLVAIADRTYYGIFNIGRQIRIMMQSVNLENGEESEYSVTLPHIYRGYSLNSAVMPLNESEKYSYNFYVFIPQLSPSVDGGYSIILSMLDEDEHFKVVTLVPFNDILEDGNSVNFYGTATGNIDINRLKAPQLKSDGTYDAFCRITVLYNQSQVFNTIF